jgi:hypothetical protein
VVNAQTREKVLEFADPHIQPADLAPLAVALCWLFKDANGTGALFAWEMQGPGIIFGKRVIELGYRNIYYRMNEQKLTPRTERDGQLTPGWYPSPDAKRTVLEMYRAALHERAFINRSEEALKECLLFRYTPSGRVEHGSESGGDDPSGARENHGDRVIADCLAYKMMKQLGFTGEREREEEVPVGSLAWRRQLHEEQRRREQAWA